MDCEICHKEFPPNRYDGSGNRYCIGCLKASCEASWEKKKKERPVQNIPVFNCDKCSGRTFVFDEPIQCYYCSNLLFEKIKENRKRKI